MTINSFVSLNKDKTWVPPTPPNGLDPVGLTKWIFQQDSMGWIKLDVNIDLDAWKKESVIAEQYYVNHRGSDNYANSEHHGWQSCCVHGIDIHRTEADELANRHLFHWTELADLTPTITHFWKEIFPVEGYKRLRFMKLDAGGYIGVHNDLPSINSATSLKDLDVLNQSIAVNVAIIHPNDCNFVTENFGTVPWKEGDVYIINITQDHCVVNTSDQSRIHMIGECVIGNRLNDFANLIYRSYKKEYGYN